MQKLKISMDSQMSEMILLKKIDLRIIWLWLLIYMLSFQIFSVLFVFEKWQIHLI